MIIRLRNESLTNKWWDIVDDDGFTWENFRTPTGLTPAQEQQLIKDEYTTRLLNPTIAVTYP